MCWLWLLLVRGGTCDCEWLYILLFLLLLLSFFLFSGLIWFLREVIVKNRMGIQVKELISVRQEMTMPIGPKNKGTKPVLMTHHSFIKSPKKKARGNYWLLYGLGIYQFPPPTENWICSPGTLFLESSPVQKKNTNLFLFHKIIIYTLILTWEMYSYLGDFRCIRVSYNSEIYYILKIVKYFRCWRT